MNFYYLPSLINVHFNIKKNVHLKRCYGYAIAGIMDNWVDDGNSAQIGAGFGPASLQCVWKTNKKDFCLEEFTFD